MRFLRALFRRCWNCGARLTAGPGVRCWRCGVKQRAHAC